MGKTSNSAIIDEEKEAECRADSRLPAIPLSSATNDTPKNVKADYKDEAITAELRELYKTFQTCLDLREKYMTRSKQRFEDDPKNKEGWEIYPEPPKPSWPLPSPEELARRKQKEKQREANPIAAVGHDFDISHIKYPEAHPVSEQA